MSDSTYDILQKHVCDNYDSLNHPHKKYIIPEEDHSTGMAVSGRLPLLVKEATKHLLKELSI